MRLRHSFVLLASLFFLSACGNSSNEQLGSEDSLHPERESLLAKSIEERADAISLTEAEAIKTEVPVLFEQAELSFSKVAITSEAELLSNYVMYPNHTISSRVIEAKPLFSRDACLLKCFETQRCGGVSYVSAVGVCYMHGPTQSFDKLAPVAVHSGKGQITFDTYVISSRNQDYNEDGNVYLNISASGSYRFKVLFADGTASTWKTPDLGPLNTKVPFKPLEGVIISATNGDGVKFNFINLYGIKCYGDCSYPDFNFPLIAWYLQDVGDGFHVSTDCDDSVEDGCAPNVGMRYSIPNQDPPYNEFITFEGDGIPLSIKDLATQTNEFVW